jgi:hypothetical protein
VIASVFGLIRASDQFIASPVDTGASETAEPAQPAGPSRPGLEIRTLGAPDPNPTEVAMAVRARLHDALVIPDNTVGKKDIPGTCARAPRDVAEGGALLNEGGDVGLHRGLAG